MSFLLNTAQGIVFHFLHQGGQTFSTEGHIEDFIATEGRMLVLYILHL